eukprot:2147006-Alexandrium_andersonii.AAC.1
MPASARSPWRARTSRIPSGPSPDCHRSWAVWGSAHCATSARRLDAAGKTRASPRSRARTAP